MAADIPSGPEGFNTTFKDIGSMIAIYDEIVAGNTNVKTKLVASIEQQDYDFGTVKSLSTFINNMVAASNNLDTAKTNLVSAVNNYVTVVTKADINSTATTVSGILADLVLAMDGATNGGSSPSGVVALTGGNFDTFFKTELSVELPTGASDVTVLNDTEATNLKSGTLPAAQRRIDDTYAD